MKVANALNLDGPRSWTSSARAQSGRNTNSLNALNLHVCDEQLLAALAQRAVRQVADQRDREKAQRGVAVVPFRVYNEGCSFTRVTAFATAAIAAYVGWSCHARCKVSGFLNLRALHVHGYRFAGNLLRARLRECETKIGANGEPNVATRDWAGKVRAAGWSCQLWPLRQCRLHGSRLTYDLENCLPKGMSQRYFDQANAEKKCLGWSMAIVRKEGQEGQESSQGTSPEAFFALTL